MTDKTDARADDLPSDWNGPSTRAVAVARQAEKGLADRATPFLLNCWYVAAFSEEVTRTLKSRTLLGRPLVLFRTLDGLPAALDERCPHRSFPLSRSILIEDTIVCGYHGLRFGRDGRCTEIPGRTGSPGGIGVRSYALREQAGVIWIWMGDQKPAEDLPLGDWASAPDWRHSHGYFHLKASYISLHENLLDLTHLSFLHETTLGTPDYVVAPYDVESDENSGRFAVVRTVAPTRLPPVWARPTGLEGVDAVRSVQSEFQGPSLHLVTARFRAYHSEAEHEDVARTAHLITPESATATHYFLCHGRNFALDDSGVTATMHEELFAAFHEDVVGLELVEQQVARTSEADFYQIAIPSDRAGLAMRRWLLHRAGS